MGGNKQSGALSRFAGPLVAVLAFGALFWIYPPFHIVKTGHASGAKSGQSTGEAFDAAAVAAKAWSNDFQAAAKQASPLDAVVTAIQHDPTGARSKYARAAGLGTVYYFVRGQGKVVSREGNRLRLALDADPTLLVELRIGPVFGNTVRDGSGLFDLNSFPGLQEFNALAAELNALVEKNVLPALVEKAQVGSVITFAGCAEAPESKAPPGQPVLILTPVEAEVR